MPVYRFGPFELDTRTMELRRQFWDGSGSGRVRLRPQPCAALACLVARHGQFVSRQELHRALWPDGTFVRFEDGLNSCIKQIRAALDDSRTSPRFIETLTRRGYRFITPVTVVADTAEVRLPPARVRVRLLPVRDLEEHRGDSGGAPLGDVGEGLVAPTASYTVAEALREELAAQLAIAAPHDIAVVAPDASAALDVTAPVGPADGSHVGDIGDDTADYALAASVRAAGSRVRVTSQLIDTRTRQHVWAGRFDASLEDPLDAESALAERIVAGVLGTIRGSGIRESASDTRHGAADGNGNRHAATARGSDADTGARPGPYAAAIGGSAISARSARGHRHDHSELTSHRV